MEILILDDEKFYLMVITNWHSLISYNIKLLTKCSISNEKIFPCNQLTIYTENYGQG